MTETTGQSFDVGDSREERKAAALAALIEARRQVDELYRKSMEDLHPGVWLQLAAAAKKERFKAWSLYGLYVEDEVLLWAIQDVEQ